MSNETKPFWDKKKVLALLILFLTFSLMMVHVDNKVQTKSTPTPNGQSQFVLAEWEYPDEHGQGIEGLEIYDNSTGSWVSAFTCDYDETLSFDWNYSIGYKLRCYSWFNSSFMLLDWPDEGKNYIRHNITVSLFNGTTIFSQQNFTYAGGQSVPPNPMWKYWYDVVLNFLPVQGNIHTVIVTYEVYY